MDQERSHRGSVRCVSCAGADVCVLMEVRAEDRSLLVVRRTESFELVKMPLDEGVVILADNRDNTTDKRLSCQV